jgi:amino acid transporter
MTAARVVSSTTKSTQKQRLSGSLSAPGIIFMVVAAAGPLAVIGGLLPLGALLGDGAGMPSMFLIDGAILAFFAVGLSAMSRHIPKGGEFFTYITYGLGRPPGVAAAWLALLCYTTAQIACIAYLGLTLGRYLNDQLQLDLPWWAWALALVVLLGLLGYRQVELSAKVLGLLLVCEIAIVLVLSIVILARGGGSGGLSLRSFHPSVVTSGSPALALMFTMGGFSGFESTAIYRDEAKDPVRTIPRATYGAIALITVFYTFTSWALVQGWGRDFQTEVSKDTSAFILTTTQRYLGSAGSQLINVLLLTSFFAVNLSFHNVTTRYVFSMSNAGLLPRRLGNVHPRFASPSSASIALTVALFAVLATFALCGLDPYLQVYTWLGGVATVTVVLLMTLTSLAVTAYFRRYRTAAGAWPTWIAPTIGGLGLLFVTVLVLQHFPLLLGDVGADGVPRVGWLTIGFYALMAGLPILGFLQALWLRRFRPATYHQIIDTVGS